MPFPAKFCRFREYFYGNSRYSKKEAFNSSDMKLRTLLLGSVLGTAALTLATAVVAQTVEYDDMYFNSKDRKQLKAKQENDRAAYQAAVASKRSSTPTEAVYADNSYTGNLSARNVNPEFAARTNAEEATEDSEYYDADYTYTNFSKASALNTWNNNYNSWYNSPWVANNYWGSSIYGWNSPYYGSYYDTWGNPWRNPYYRSGWGSSFSFYWGSSWNYGWGNNWGWGFSYGNPYYNSWYGWGGPSYAWGPSWGWGYGGWYNRYPSVVIINNEYGRNYAYGKRGSQSGMVTRQQGITGSRTRPTNTTPTNSGSRPVYNGSSGGRVSTNSVAPSRQTRDADYYNRNWRTSRQSSAPTYSQPSRSSQQPSRSTSPSWNNSRSSSSSPSYNSGNSNSGRSSGFSSGGGSTRSSSSGSGSGGRTRGGN